MHISILICVGLHMGVSTKCILLLYADDSILLTSDKDPKVIEDTLSRNMETCKDYLVDNRLSRKFKFGRSIGKHVHGGDEVGGCDEGGGGDEGSGDESDGGGGGGGDGGGGGG